MKMWKKGVALLLALMMLATALPFGGLAVLAEEIAAQTDASDYPELPLDVTTTVVIENEFDTVNFSFTPEEDGYYVFYSLAPEGVDTKGSLFDGHDLVENDDDGEFNNFRIVRYLTAGVTCHLQAYFWDTGTGSYPVRIERTELRAITAVDFSDRICMIGDRLEDGTFDLYPRMTVTYSDGTTEESESYWLHDDANTYEVCVSYDVPMQEWVEDGTYTATVTLTDSDLCGTFTVTVEGSPVVSVSMDRKTHIQNYHGWETWDWIWDEETGEEYQSPRYWRYDIDPWGLEITLKDGTVIHGTDFMWNGQHFSVHYIDEQRYDNQWGVGAHIVQASIAGFDFSYVVEVIENPVTSVVVTAPVTIFENSDGYWDRGSYWDEKLQESVEYEYFHYYSINPRTIITLKDGSVWEDNWIEWNGERWGMSIDGQSHERNLSKGANTWHGNVLGYDFTYEIEVIDTPVASVTVDPITVVENTNGYWQYSTHYDEQGNPYEVKWYYYHNMWPRNVVITLKDGTVINGSSFVYNGVEFGMSTYGQGYDTRLQVGANELRAFIAGYEFTYPVEVLESPVASVTANPITLIAHQSGYWRNEYVWDEEQQQDVYVEWFYYHNTVPSITVTLKDGTVIHGGYFEWNEMSFGMSITNQWYSNRLLPGKNIHTGTIGGYEFEYVINIATVASNDTYEYMETEDGVIITDCYAFEETLEIPAAIDGQPVIGIAGLGWSEDVRHLIIPDSVVTLGEYVLENLQALQSIHFGAGVSTITPEMLRWLYELNTITVSADSDHYCVVDGVLYDKAMTTFIAYPVASGKTDYEVPVTVVNIGGLDYRIYRNLNVTFAEGHLAYKSVDGVIYDKDMTTILSVRKDKTGDYVMPETVETITDGAFNGSALTSVVVSPKVTEIVYCAFANCASLESVTLPEGLISIEMAAFENTPALQSITLPSTLEYIGVRAFDNGGLTSLTVPGSVQSIGYAAFRNSKIEVLTLNEGIEGIENYAFAYTPLRALSLPASIDGVGHYAFAGCRDLATVNLGTGLQYVGDGAFSNTGIQSLHVPANVIFIGENGFAHSQIGQLTFAEGIGEICERAFYNCDNLTAVHLPASLSYLGAAVFGSCDSLCELTATEGKHYFSAGNCVISHDGMLVAGCQTSEIPQDGSVESIADYAFFMIVDLESVDLPDGLKRIGDYAFYECDALTSVIVPDSVTYLGVHAFTGADNLSSVQMGNNIEFMGSGIFAGTALNAIDLGDSVPYIAPYAFEGTALQEIFLPSSVTAIMYEAFIGCEQLTSVEIPITVTSIEENAFGSCDALTDVYYQGTEADRDKMYISQWGNEALLNATWHYEWTNDNWAEITCDHVYDHRCDATCNLCGEQREVQDHEYDSVTTDATCGSSGLTVYTCIWCGDTYEEFIPATDDHVYDNGCDGDCNQCGYCRPTDPHDFHPEEVVPNDCGNDGLMGFTCSVCGAYYEEIIPATGEHVYDNGCDGDCNLCGYARPTDPHDFHAEVIAPNDCSNDGLMGFTCSVCGAYYEEIIPATGEHVYDNACDAECNGCGLVRPVDDHVYDNACDAYCNICDEERLVGDHVYDNKYDADCNVCGAIREVPLQPAFTAFSGNAIIGETVDVWVDVENNSGIVQATFDIHYDGSVLELVECSGGVFDGVVFTPAGASVMISWSGIADNFDNGTMARFTFRLKDGVTPGSTAVSVSYKAASILNEAGEEQEFLVNDRIVNIYENVRGDADGDGKVSTRDLAEMIQDLNGWDVEVVPELMDVDADGKTTNRDYVLLSRYYNDWDVELQ